MIYTKFLGSPLTAEEARQVKEIDNALLQSDLHALFAKKTAGPAPLLAVPPDYAFRPFKEVELHYLDLYDRLKNQ